MTRTSRTEKKPYRKTVVLQDHVIAVVERLRDYWPVTLRQIYYQLVAHQVIGNNRNKYQLLSRTLTAARIQKLIPWEAMEDRARDTLESGGYCDKSHFLQLETDDYLTGYRRDLLQSQPKALELWVEKDALSRLCYEAAYPYCVPVVVARGFASISYLHELAERVRRNAKRGKDTTLLYFGDFDPSGLAMLPAMLTTLEQDFNLGKWVVADRIALTVRQIDGFDLPVDPDALKKSDSRYEKFLKEHGRKAVELDALPPATLVRLVAEAIEAHLDLDAFHREEEQENLERADLTKIKLRVDEYLEGLGLDAE